MQRNIFAQANFGTRDTIFLNLVTDFGAIPNDGMDDSYALIKAARYIENKWYKNGNKLTAGDVNIHYNTHFVMLTIDSGTYDIGREVSLTAPPYDSFYHVYPNTGTPPTQLLKYATLYNDTIANHNEGIEIIPYSLLSCYGPTLFAPRKYYSVELFNILNDSTNLGNLIDGILYKRYQQYKTQIQIYG